VRSPGRDRSPIAPSGSPNGLPLVASVGCGRLPSPSLPAGYQVSSTCPSAVVVAKPMPQAGDVETVTELPSFALSSQIGRLGHPGSAIPDRLSRIGHPGSAEAAAGPVSGQACGHSAVPALRKGTVRTMPNPLTPEVLADPVALTRALVDVESVSRNEKEIADYVIEALEKVPHLSVTRFGNTVMARTSLGRPRRVVLAGHLDTVPPAGNLPSRVEGDLIYGCGTSDMKSGVALALHLAVTLPDPRYDVTYFFYEAEEIDSRYNGLNLVAQHHPDWLTADFALLLEPTHGVIEAGCQGTMRAIVRTTGRRAHSARSWRGVNAIHAAGEVL